MKREIISILMPFKDEEAYITACIDSILDQTDPDWELIAVDDGSTDSSPELVKQYAASDKRIQYLENQGKGVIHALRTAFKNATGALVTRMDADDIKTPDNLEVLRAKVKPGCLAIGKVTYFKEGGIGEGYRNYGLWLNELTGRNENFSRVYQECVVPSPCWLAYRKDFEKAGAFDSELYPEDYDLCFRFYQAGLSTAGTEGIIHHWRDYPTRTTRTSEHYLDNRFLHLKVKYFLQTDYSSNRNLVLWGAGKKAKAIAQRLKDEEITFDWVTSNPKKIGHNIYGVVLDDARDFKANDTQQIIVAVASLSGKRELETRLENSRADIFWFC